MKVSKKCLNDFIDITNIDYHELAEKMVFAGNEYETITKLSDATNVVVGNVIECIKHPESTKLSICKVDDGNDIIQILCGAANVKQGIKVIVAKVGATLPGNITITKASLAGMESNGMICSLSELGIENKYLTEEDKNGIHILNDDAVVGANAIEYLGYDDEIIDFELTSNRSDLLSYIGMSYEVGALYNKQIKMPNTDYKEIEENINTNYKLDIQTNNCYSYLASLVKNVSIKESPMWLKNKLMANGIRPINNVVDISNLVMLEYGTPLHFFDADKLGNTVIVRMANEQEPIITLDSNDVLLNDTDIVIANPNGPVCLAGVMGGLDTEVTDKTKNVFIESAIFNPYSIRFTSKKILRSEASNRFEKGIDPNASLPALKRACHLLEKYAEGNVCKSFLNYDTTDKNDKNIDINLNNIISVLGMNLTIKDIENIFKRLGFKCEINDNNFKVFVPTRRLDINIKEDLIEEVGRIYGYEHVVGILPSLPIKEGSRSTKATMIYNIRKRLESLGLNQVITYSLVNEADINKFESNKLESVVLSNAMSEYKKYMRKSMIPSLLQVFDYNNARSIKDINIFECASVYYKKDVYIEESKCSGILYGNYITNLWQNNIIKVDFYVLKGIIENILNYLGFNNRYTFNAEILSEMHPKRSCTIKIDNDIIGYMGQIHPLINKKEIYVFELSIDKILEKKVRNIKYKEISKYPSVSKDVAFIVNKSMTSDTISKVIKKSAGRYLINIDVFDIYEGSNVLEDEKSIAYSLTFADATKTLNEEEITNMFNKVIDDVETNCHAKLRNK